MPKTTEAMNGCEAWAATDSAAMADHAEEGRKNYKPQHTEASRVETPSLWNTSQT